MHSINGRTGVNSERLRRSYSWIFSFVTFFIGGLFLSLFSSAGLGRALTPCEIFFCCLLFYTAKFN
jgi:hypothetical protein